MKNEDCEVFIRLIELYQELENMEVVDRRVKEAVIQMIMSFIPFNIEVKLDL